MEKQKPAKLSALQMMAAIYRDEPITDADRLRARRLAIENSRQATEIQETKTEGRTPRQFRTNPHE